MGGYPSGYFVEFFSFSRWAFGRGHPHQPNTETTMTPPQFVWSGDQQKWIPTIRGHAGVDPCQQQPASI